MGFARSPIQKIANAKEQRWAGALGHSRIAFHLYYLVVQASTSASLICSSRAMVYFPDAITGDDR